MLRQANRHIDNLKSQIDAFVDEKPWTHIVEKDVDGITDVHKIKFGERFVDDLPNIIFDAANNLRSVLDQAGYASAVLSGNTVLKATKFPVGPTKEKMLNNATGGCKDLPPEITALFISFNPYKGGNDLLWALNELCNTPKHKIIIPVQTGGALHFVETGIYTGPTRVTAPEWDAEKNEIVLLRGGSGSEIDYEGSFSFTVAIDDAQEIVGGEPPIGALRAMAAEVESILMATEAECRRIGLID